MGDSDGKVTAKDTREVIMEATFRALRKQGYSNLRLRDIGEEMDLTRQVIHYHFDGKYDLLASFMEYIVEQYEGSVEVETDADPRAELDARIDQDDACGATPLRGLLLAAKRRGMTVKTLDLCNSGDTGGDRDFVVGYGAWMFA